MTTDAAERLMQAVLNSPRILTFRWINLLSMREGHWERATLSKIIQVETKNKPVSRQVYLNPFFGDLAWEIATDVFKCQYWRT